MTAWRGRPCPSSERTPVTRCSCGQPRRLRSCQRAIACATRRRDGPHLRRAPARPHGLTRPAGGWFALFSFGHCHSLRRSKAMGPGREPPQHFLVRAARGEPVGRPPVWAMRQAGRWDPEFNRLRAGRSFYQFSEDVELSARASLLPRRFGVDGIILFYDITTLPVAMGQPFQLRPAKGPVPDWAVRSPADVARLAAEPDPERYRHVRELLRLVRADLGGALPVL